ncbi:hypothetical protein [Halopiger xanaduensis]|uniref:Uncharacterized protein n=1 Tax=Halopiger xanaduensis (strain DSM 18323 / JCM 14033 / SH-6) TaxID=797210 RepID=F8D5R3_HALXS|nr:hypothetical protein [Halopiger xanaduensis]AEH36485.1 hypothetical protein Halxa_1857 [Halopiger xanaduensis SH-6]
MVSRENRVIAGSFVLFVLAIVGLLALETVTGVAAGEYPLVAFLVVYGLPVVAPQLYLAATGSGDVSPRTRVRFAVAFSGVFALVIVGGADVDWSWSIAFDDLETVQYTLLGAIGIGAFAGLLCYEVLEGYRSSTADTAP